MRRCGGQRRTTDERRTVTNVRIQPGFWAVRTGRYLFEAFRQLLSSCAFWVLVDLAGILVLRYPGSSSQLPNTRYGAGTFQEGAFLLWSILTFF